MTDAMKLLFLLLLLPVLVVAGDRPMALWARNSDPVIKQTFEATCPCGKTCKLKPIAVSTIGSRTQEQDGVKGYVMERSLTFKCSHCKEPFSKRTEDTFVPDKPRAKRVVVK